jgi:3-deoxy-D-manno-octulosonic-acid transferase
MAERVGAVVALEEWGRSRPEGPLVWLHGASAGELLGAAPAIAAARRRTESGVIVTHFSPSGVTALPHLDPDFAGYPPLETRADCERALAAVRPDALVFAKLDVWPGLTLAAARAGVPVGMINASVRRQSSRLRLVSRVALRSTYASLARVGAASEEDAARLVLLGVRPGVLSVTGDAAFDLAVARADAAGEAGSWRDRLEAALPPRPESGVRIVAGSTWPADEEALLSALGALRGAGRPIQAVVAPHQPTESRVTRLMEACGRNGFRAVRWSGIMESTPPRTTGDHGDVVVFDSVGTLAELYTVGDLAYVGGALGDTGLHNVLEPAAAAVPVLFGPRRDRREADDLVASGAAFQVTPETFASVLEGLLDDTRRTAAGGAGRRYVDSRCGAGEAAAELILGLIGDTKLSMRASG